jgi:glucose/mannose-6-phosphate isomerase
MRNVIGTSLDDMETYSRLDREDMLGDIKGMPELCEMAWRSALDFKLPERFRNVDKVVILGMGGSAIGGDLVSSLVVGESRVPIILCRNYHIPAFVDDKTLVIASSYLFRIP